MNGRRFSTGVVALVAAAGLMGAATTSAQAAPTSAVAPTAGPAAAGTTNPAGTVTALYSAVGFQRLIDAVTAQVHAQYPAAELGDAVGTSLSGPTTSIRDVTRWVFNYTTVDETGSPMIVRATVFLPSWTASLTTQRNAAITGRALTQPVAMSPFQATVRLHVAGYREPFRSVVYAQPIIRSGAVPNPVYLIDQSAARIAVDTVTRQVSPFS